MLKMALSNLLDPGESEQYKYHILLDHLKVDQAYVYAPDPYTQAIRKGKGKGKWCVAKYGDPYSEFVLCI